MIACSTFFSSWALIVATIGLGERIHLRELVEASNDIAVGASPDDVQTTLGKPNEKWDPWQGFLILGGRPPRWVYGATVDLESIIVPELPFPNPLPIHLRLFGAAEDDLVIEWTPDQKVARVARAYFEVPQRGAELFEPFYVVAEIIRWLMLTERVVL